VYDSVIGELSGQVRLPGFRPGKVPRTHVEKMFKNEIRQHVMGEALGRAFQTSVKKENLKVVGEPKFDFEKIELERGKELKFEVEVEVKPELQLGNYKGLPVEQEEVEVFPEEVEAELKTIASRHGEAIDAPAEATVENGDAVQGICRYLDGEQELKKVDEQYLMVGQGKVYGLHADLQDAFLLGAKMGEKRSVECELDKEIEEEDLRGKKVKLEFEPKRIRRAQVPEINDELAKRLGATDMAGLKQRVEEHIREHLAEATNAKVRRDLVERVVAATPFEAPVRLLESFRQNATEQQKRWLASMGLTDEHMAEREGALKEQAGKTAEQELRTFFILDAIANKENLEPNDDDIDDEILKLARKQNVRAAELFDHMREHGELEELKLELRTRKATEFLVDNAEIKIIPRKRPEAEKKEEANTEAKEEPKEESKAEAKSEEKPAGEQ
jgi:trigger factor